MWSKPTRSTGRLEVVPDNRSSVKSIPERIAAIRVLTHEERVDLAESEVRILDYGSHYLVDQAIIGVHESVGGVLSAVYARARLIHCMMLERWLGNLGSHSDEAFRDGYSSSPHWGQVARQALPLSSCRVVRELMPPTFTPRSCWGIRLA